MKKTSRALAAGVGSALVAAGAMQGVALAGGAGAPLQASASDAGAAIQPAAARGQQVEQAGATTAIQQDEVVGTFGYTQSEVSSNEWIAKHIGGASKYLCGSRAVAGGAGSQAVDAEDWVLEVTGDVANPFSATMKEIAQTSEVQQVMMGCTCAANPADGLSVANALVEGISTTALLQIAGVDPAANTIVFTSADGYEVALPLRYVTTRYCPLVFNVNGASLVESVGGTNQLWLGSTPGNYFARDIVSIRIETRDTPPADPTSDEARASYENLPNIGVKFGGEVQA